MAFDVAKGSKIKQGRGSHPGMTFKAEATETIAKGKIVAVTGTKGSAASVSALVKGSPLYRKVALATNATKSKAHGELYIALTGATSGQTLDICPIGLLANLDTSGGAVGDPVYLSTAGNPTLTAAGYRRKIGSIVTVGVSGTGVIAFDPAANPPISTVPIIGTAAVSAATSVNVTSGTLGGTFGGAPAFATCATTSGVIYVVSCTWSTDTLVITFSASFTGNVNYQVWV